MARRSDKGSITSEKMERPIQFSQGLLTFSYNGLDTYFTRIFKSSYRPRTSIGWHSCLFFDLIPRNAIAHQNRSEENSRARAFVKVSPALQPSHESHDGLLDGGRANLHWWTNHGVDSPEGQRPKAAIGSIGTVFERVEIPFYFQKRAHRQVNLDRWLARTACLICKISAVAGLILVGATTIRCKRAFL